MNVGGRKYKLIAHLGRVFQSIYLRIFVYSDRKRKKKLDSYLWMEFTLVGWDKYGGYNELELSMVQVHFHEFKLKKISIIVHALTILTHYTQR